MIDVSSIKKRIRDAREKMGLSQEEMAQRLGIKRNAYRAFEAGSTQLVNLRLKDFAEQTGCTQEFLLLGYEPARPQTEILRTMRHYEQSIRDLRTDYENRLEAKDQVLRDKDALIASLDRTIKVQQDMISILQK